MHALYEVRQVLEQVHAADRTEGPSDDLLRMTRVGLVLLSLGGAQAGSRTALKTAWQRLQQAEDEGLLQVFLDQDGICRGYAILAMFDVDTHDRLISDIRELGEAKSSKSGECPWLLAISGGQGQGWAIARHLRDNFLACRNSLTYPRRLNGQLMLKTLSLGRPRGLGRTRDPIRVEQATRFTQFRLMRDELRRFYHYLRLHAEADSADRSLAYLHNNFLHVHALVQYRFDDEDYPTGAVTWALLNRGVMRRIEYEGSMQFRPGDWRSGPIPCLVDVLGNQGKALALIDHWRKQHPYHPPVRVVIDPGKQQMSFADVG